MQTRFWASLRAEAPDLVGYAPYARPEQILGLGSGEKSHRTAALGAELRASPGAHFAADATTNACAVSA
ncbi:MAG: hypothetical protein WCJ67_10990 [Thermoleophilia bacterium]